MVGRPDDTGGSNGVGFRTFHNRFPGCGIPRVVGCEPVNAAGFLNHLLAGGVAKPVPTRVGTAGVVVVRGFEVAAAVDCPGERSMRARWRERVGNRPVSYLLVADDPDRSGWLRVLGPASVDSPIRSVDASGLVRAVGDTVEMGALEGVRHLAEEVVRLGGEGLHMEGLLSRHTVEVRFKGNEAVWAEASGTTAAALRPSDGWRGILTKLGYRLEQLPTRGYLARYEGRPVAVVHPKNSPRAFTRLDDRGRPPEGLLAGDCRAAGTGYGLLAYEGRFRLFDTASTQEWLGYRRQFARRRQDPVPGAGIAFLPVGRWVR